MKFKMSVLIVMLSIMGLVLLPAAAQPPATATVSYNGFSFSYDPTMATHVDIDTFPGDPVALEVPGGPEVKHVQFAVSNTDVTPSIFDATLAIRVYDTADFASYANQQGQLAALQNLLAQKVDLGGYMVAPDNVTDSTLPFVPIMPAAQVIRARAQYIETASVRGIGYITMYRQDVAPFLGSEFFYTFQGISTDGAHYVSAIFKLNTGLFPAEVPADFNMDTFNAGFTDYLTQSIATLNNAQPTDFNPALTMVDAVIQSFSFAASSPSQPPVEPPVSRGDSSLGGLAGVNWVLTSFGGNAVLPTVPITLTFAQEGISGSAGCNSYFGQFIYDVGTLTFGGIGSTLMACEEPIMTQEGAYLEALRGVTNYQLADGQLTLGYADGVLTYQAAGVAMSVTPTVIPPVVNTDPTLGGLGGVAWTLVSYGPLDAPIAVLPDAPVTIDFTAQGVSGSAGCNRYSGTFVYNINTLTFSPLVRTEMACADAVNAQEAAYLAALQASDLYLVTNGMLQIVYPDGLLVFTGGA